MLDKQELKKLYNSGLSMIEISEKKDWPYEAVKYWMDKYKIEKKSRAELCYRGYWRKKYKNVKIPDSIRFAKQLNLDKVKAMNISRVRRPVGGGSGL